MKMVVRIRRTRSVTGDFFSNNLLKPASSLDDVTCPICLDILIEPVTTPCYHEACLDCFKKNVEFVHIACPVCRLRLSVWVRHAVRDKKLVNNSRWEQIKRSFPDHVRRRLNGEDESFCKNDVPAVHTKPGEIRKEYEELLKKYEEDRERERKEEALASEQLIRELLAQEGHQMVEGTVRKHHVTRQNEALNRDVCRVNIKTIRTRSQSSNTTLHQISDIMKGSITSEVLASLDTENTQSRSASAESHDSISSEMCHFKPISAAPRTPPKRLPDGRFQEPEVVYTKPRRLEYSDCQSSKILSVKIEAIMANSRGLVQFHSSSTTFINKKPGSARKSNIDLSLKENYPFYSGNRSQSSSPTKSVLTGSNGSASTRGIRNTLGKRKVDEKSVPCKTMRVGDRDETNASTSKSRPQSTNHNQSKVELQERIIQEEKDRLLALQMQEEFNKNQQPQHGNQYFLRSQKKK